MALTGATGFLGWHTRAALKERDIPTATVKVGTHFDPIQAVASLAGASRVIHLAGINRATQEEIKTGNVLFAEQLASALRKTENPPGTVVYANTVQANNSTTYGSSKAQAALVLETAAADIGADFVDVRLPNLFGEHGRPFYNSVTATFSHLIAGDGSPVVDKDRELTLLHAQHAADVLTGAIPVRHMARLQEVETVSGLLSRLQRFASQYRDGDIPDVANMFDRDLFNTYRSYTFPSQAPIALNRHTDERGSFFEIIRSHGGHGQSSFSTTAPGVTRGNHFHRRKIERFSVLQGQARISLRRLYTDEVISFEVSGEAPQAVDMPTMWVHNIQNIGHDELLTSFWTNDHFDAQHPDTIAELV